MIDRRNAAVAVERSFRKYEVAVCSQQRTISVDQHVGENLGSVPDERMDEVDSALRYSLDLTPV